MGGSSSSHDIQSKSSSPQTGNANYASRPDRDRFFVIAPIFNPASFRTRYKLYHDFVEHMRLTGAQLVTVECIFPSLGQHEFRVTKPNNLFHIQLRSESVYWVKEALINIAVSRLPPHAKWVCWLDTDITFHDKDWVHRTIKALERYTVVQVFEKAKFLGPPPDKKVLRKDYSFGYSVVHHKPIDQNKYDEWYPHPGYGWAMSVSAFRKMGGLPIYDIVGSGDLHFAFSLINRVSNALETDLNEGFKQMIMSSSDQIYGILSRITKSEGKSGVVGYAPLKISHNWHGSRKDRQYVNRWKILIAWDFNFLADTEITQGELLQLNPNKPDLQRDIIDHFHMRHEDSNERASAKDNAVVVSVSKLQQQQKKKYKPPLPHRKHSSSGFSHHDRFLFSGTNNDSRDHRDDPYLCCHGIAHHGCGNFVGEQQGMGGQGLYCDDYGGSVQCTSQY
jgi:hypothetical protein